MKIKLLSKTHDGASFLLQLHFFELFFVNYHPCTKNKGNDYANTQKFVKKCST